jgi:anti-sigma B factor antagonist
LINGPKPAAPGECHFHAVQLLPVRPRNDLGDDAQADRLPPISPPDRGPTMAYAARDRAQAEGWAGHGLTITIVKRDPLRANLRLVGELDLASMPILEACLENLLATGSRYVRADLSGLAFLDCAGLGALARAHIEFLRERGTLILTGASVRTRRVMALAQLEDVLFVAADLPAAALVPVG